MESAPAAETVIDRFLQSRFRTRTPDEREIKRASDALARRGFRWNDVKEGLSRYTDGLPEDE
jgi:regulatory protein